MCVKFGHQSTVLAICIVPIDKVKRKPVPLGSGSMPSDGMDHSIWERIERLIDLDVDTTSTVLNGIVQSELNGPHPHPNVSDIEPALQHALRAENQTVR